MPLHVNYTLKDVPLAKVDGLEKFFRDSAIPFKRHVIDTDRARRRAKRRAARTRPPGRVATALDGFLFDRPKGKSFKTDDPQLVAAFKAAGMNPKSVVDQCSKRCRAKPPIMERLAAKTYRSIG